MSSALPKKELIKRWLKKWKFDPNTKCHNFTGYISSFGYGNVTIRKKTTKAHRFFYEQLVGPISKGTGYHGTCVLHKCDNRRCVNPKHLFLGTQADNIKDTTQKNRVVKGTNHHSSKLTHANVRWIRKNYKGRGDCRRFGKKFGVWGQAISDVMLRKTWTHIK